MPTNYVATQTTTNTGFVPVTPQYAIQSIIDYLNTLDTDQVQLNGEYIVCYIDAQGVKQTVTVGNVTSGAGKNNLLTDLLTELSENGCTTVDYILSTKSVSCESIQALFPASVNPVQANDRIYMSKSDGCSFAYPSELFLAMLQLVPYDAILIEAFCSLLNLCSGGQPCLPYNVLNVEVISYDADCPDVIDFQYSFEGQDFQIDVINFANTPTGIQTVAVYYKLQSDPSYTLISGSVSVNTSGVPSVLPSFETGTGLTYDIKIVQGCGSPADEFAKAINSPGATPISDTYDVSTTEMAVCSSPVGLILFSTATFAPGVTLYTDIELSTPVTGYNYIKSSGGMIYNLNTSTGVIGATTGNSC